MEIIYLGCPEEENLPVRAIDKVVGTGFQRRCLYPQSTIESGTTVTKTVSSEANNKRADSRSIRRVRIFVSQSRRELDISIDCWTILSPS